MTTTYSGYLREVDTPLKMNIRDIFDKITFLFLGVTITVAILWFLNPEENYEPITVILGIVITFFSLMASKSSVYRSKNSEENYDIFISAPMAAFENNHKYEENRIFIIKLKQILKKECNLKSFYAGDYIQTDLEFEAENISLRKDIGILKASKYFLMVYPEKLVSSVLVEAGLAMAMEKPSVYFVRNINHLPFLLKQAGEAISEVHIRKYNNAEDIFNYIKNNREEIFLNSTSAFGEIGEA